MIYMHHIRSLAIKHFSFGKTAYLVFEKWLLRIRFRSRSMVVIQ